MKRILPALPCHVILIPNLLVHKRVEENNNTNNERESALPPTYPDLRVYQAGNDAQLGLNFRLRYVTMLHPVERITARKIYVTFAIHLQSVAYIAGKDRGGNQ